MNRQPMENVAPRSSESQKYPRVLSILFWWLVLTGIYMISIPFVAALPPGNPLIRLFLALALFVPFGFFNAYTSFIQFLGIPVALFLVSAFLMDKLGAFLYFRHRLFSAVIIANLLFLLLATLVIDLTFWHCWLTIDGVAIGGTTCLRFPLFN